MPRSRFEARASPTRLWEPSRLVLKAFLLKLPCRRVPVASLHDAWPEIVATAASFFLVLYSWPAVQRWRAWVDRRAKSLDVARWLDWRTLTVALGVIFLVAAFVQSAPVGGCPNTSDDTGSFLYQGQALWMGQDPFQLYRCGVLVPIPIGLAGILLNALGSLGGRPGIWIVWEFLALLLIPLTWVLAGKDRRFVTLFVASSGLFVPLVIGQIEGDNSAFGAVAVLVPVWLASRGKAGAGLLAGFLSTMKFPSLFPFLGATGGFGRVRDREMLLTWVGFVGGSAIAWAIWGPVFISTVFFGQLGRHDVSVNEFGVLIGTGWFPPVAVLAMLQGVALFGSVAFVYFRRWPAIPALALTTIVVCLVIPRLPFNFLVWLIPLALLGIPYCRWLFVLTAVGALNSAVAIPLYLNVTQPVYWPSQLLGGLMGLILILVAFQLVREQQKGPVDPQRATAFRLTGRTAPPPIDLAPPD
ncbi:MAG: hypothetical protein WB778_01430 [Thermoplasmata archaeon]